MGLHHELGDNGYSLWIAWSSRSQKFDKSAADASWRSFKNGGDITIATVFYYAKQYGYTRSQEAQHDCLTKRLSDFESRGNNADAFMSSSSRRKGQQSVADNAAELYRNLPTLGKHPYLSLKRCGAYGLKIWYVLPCVIP